MRSRVLIVDDARAECELLADGLRVEGFDPAWVLTGGEALAALAHRDFDVVITDLNMPAMNGTELCEQIRREHPELPVVVVTAFGSIDMAVRAMRASAYDFITKPFEVETLAMTLTRAVEHRRLRREVERLKRAVDESQRFGALLGSSAAMREVYEILARFVDTESIVLITGESGTGKEVVARELHRRSARAVGPFVMANCGGLPEAILENELFGFDQSHAGLLFKAHGGTLFLDQIADLPLAVQPKLLRAIQERTIPSRAGSSGAMFDARVIVATNRDLETAVDTGDFREDLFHRINVMRIDLPPLRSRGGDVLMLAKSFVEQFSAQRGGKPLELSPSASEKLLTYAWPGNVRELRNCIERAVALARSTTIEESDLPERVRTHKSDHVLVVSDDPRELAPLEEIERRYILRVLEASGGNKSLAAQVLGLSRKTLYRRLEEYGIPTDDARE
jgi:two-component system response regulator HydG